METLDCMEVKKHIHIKNVAFHACIEIVDDSRTENKAICPFCRL